MIGGPGAWTGLFSAEKIHEWYELRIADAGPLLVDKSSNCKQNSALWTDEQLTWHTVWQSIQQINDELRQTLAIPPKTISILAVAQLFRYEHFNDLLRHEDEVCQDMTRPLAHYYISCSHNTCCMEDQYATDCQPSVFEWCLLQGCRCIELDMWDGAASEPVVCHGPSTGRCSLYAALKAIRETAFLRSPFPLIISLDNNCGDAAQLNVARIIDEVLHDLLIMPGTLKKPVEQHSPEELRGRIIIRGKKPDVKNDELSGFIDTLRLERSRRHSGANRRLSRNHGIVTMGQSMVSESMDDCELIDEGEGSSSSQTNSTYSLPHLTNEPLDILGPAVGVNEEVLTSPCSTEMMQIALEVRTETHSEERQVGTQSSENGADSPSVSLNFNDESGNIGDDDESDSEMEMDLETHDGKVTQAHASMFEKKRPPPPELQALTTMLAVRLPGTPAHFKSNSFTVAEAKVCEMFERADITIIRKWHYVFNSFMIRTFPPPTCVYSENYDPQSLWATGVHAVALNFQHIDADMALQRAWFERNGSAGYVLKPPCLLELSEGKLCVEMKQPEKFFSEMPTSKSSDTASVSQAAQQLMGGRVSSPASASWQHRSLILKIDIKFAYWCQISDSSQAYYPINTETKELKSKYGNALKSAVTESNMNQLKSFRHGKSGKFYSEQSSSGEMNAMRTGMLRVQMEIRGVKPDQKKVSTRECFNLQGFGAWDEQFQFPLLTKNTALCSQLYVEIVHDTAGVIANRAFPLSMLRRGNGELRLLDPFRLCGAQTTACLVCNLDIEEAALSREDFIKLKRLQSTEDQIANESFGL